MYKRYTAFNHRLIKTIRSNSLFSYIVNMHEWLIRCTEVKIDERKKKYNFHKSSNIYASVCVCMCVFCISKRWFIPCTNTIHFIHLLMDNFILFCVKLKSILNSLLENVFFLLSCITVSAFKIYSSLHKISSVFDKIFSAIESNHLS